jgi:uncharacterized surface protein with fasciclin (FAS1) repeats
MRNSSLKLIVQLVVIGLMLIGCGGQQSESEDTLTKNTHGQAGVVDKDSKKNILQIAMGSPDHTTLVAAVQAASLENVLVNPGPLTVFAPTNAAFAALPEGTVETLLKPENKDKLAQIVTSHAAPGTYKGELLNSQKKIYQASGHYAEVEVKDGATYVHGAKILATIDASNGVVHVVDKVFLFPEK